MKPGDTVRYYLNGWRVGHLEEIDKGRARIRPVAGYGANPRCRWVPLEDIEPCDKEK